MLFIILGVIFGIAIGIYTMIDCGEWWNVLYPIIYGFVGFLIGIIVWFLIGWIGFFLPYNETVTTQEICALNDSSEVEGQKFLFSGYIEENLVYRYVVESDKGKHIEECKVEDAYIKDIESKKPYVEYHSYEFKSYWFYLFAIDWKALENYSVFYVPDGTITSEYNVDLQ